MKALVTIALLLTASAAAAQPAAQLPHADVQGAIGWQNLRTGPTLSNNNWINSIPFADAAAGWYWTEHLRTQVDAGVGSTGRSTRFVDRSTATRSRFQTIDTDVRPTATPTRPSSISIPPPARTSSSSRAEPKRGRALA